MSTPENSTTLRCAHVLADGPCGVVIKECKFSESSSGYEHAEGAGNFLHFAVPSLEFEQNVLPGLIDSYQKIHLAELFGEAKK